MFLPSFVAEGGEQGRTHVLLSLFLDCSQGLPNGIYISVGSQTWGESGEKVGGSQHCNAKHIYWKKKVPRTYCAYPHKNQSKEVENVNTLCKT